MPQGTLNKRYLNDDRKETIKAAVEGTLLTVNNIGTGSNVRGLYGSGEDFGVYGYSPSGTGVHGTSNIGTAVHARGGLGLPLKVEGISGTNLIEAWDEGDEPDDLRFNVVRSTGDVHADGSFYAGQDVSVSALLRVGQYSADPATCDSSAEGAIYYNTTDDTFYGCNGSAWQALN